MAKLGSFTATQVLTAAELNSGAGAWSTYSPSYANITIGNGTVIAKQAFYGRTWFFKWLFNLGSTSSIGTGPTISTPIQMADTAEAYSFVGMMLDAALGYYPIIARPISSTTFTFSVFGTASTYAGETNVTAAAPGGMGTSDVISISGFFEGTS